MRKSALVMAVIAIGFIAFSCDREESLGIDKKEWTYTSEFIDTAGNHAVTAFNSEMEMDARIMYELAILAIYGKASGRIGWFYLAQDWKFLAKKEECRQKYATELFLWGKTLEKEMRNYLIFMGVETSSEKVGVLMNNLLQVQGEW
jgi:hypothetical protein